MKEEITQALDNLVHWQGFSGDAGPQEAADLIRGHIESVETAYAELLEMHTQQGLNIRQEQIRADQAEATALRLAASLSELEQRHQELKDIYHGG